MILAVTFPLSARTYASDQSPTLHSIDQCDGNDIWFIAVSSDDRGRSLPMRMHLDGRNVSIIAFADGSHAPTHDLQLPPIRLVWRGSGQVCCDMRDDISSFIKVVQSWEVHMSLKLQLVDLSGGVAPITPLLRISQGSFDVTHEFNDVLSIGYSTSQHQPLSTAAAQNTSACSWLSSVTISMLAPQLYNTDGLSSVVQLKSGDIVRTLLSINEIHFQDLVTSKPGSFKPYFCQLSAFMDFYP
jgi:hypothetical protein